MGDERRFSIFMVKILRHDAKDRGLSITRDGYVKVQDILDLHEASRFDVDDVQRIVRNDTKGRFKIRGIEEDMEIKATQGHTMGAELELSPITHYTDARVVLHGTTYRSWEKIKTSGGLSRMKRDHIHFAPGDRGVQSGMPGKCELAIEINLKTALKDGIKFYRSENGVILSPGNFSGMIPKKHFQRVYNIKTRETVQF